MQCAQGISGTRVRALGVGARPGRPVRGPRRGAACRAEAPGRQRPEYEPQRISDPNYVRIFDTTLRDGEQSPGATLTSKEKMEIAKQLSKLGVDVIEAGFPMSSPDDFQAVKSIAQEVGTTVVGGYSPVICGLARCREPDLERSWDAVRHARLPRVHYFIATSPIHMEYKLRMGKDQVLRAAVRGAEHLRSLGCRDIEFSAEDATRSDPDFLVDVLSAAIEAGATTVNIPDTTGWALPQEFGGLIELLRRRVRGAKNVVFSTHCQNDLGLSTANSLAGAAAGARQVEGTINGIGERAGNASLEEIIMAIALRGEEQLGGLWTGAQPVHIAPTSKMVCDFSGMAIQPHKAIVGANAFAHESGIHQDGMLKNRGTYEIMTPESVGIVRADPAGLVMGKHSGRHALVTRLHQLGVTLADEQIDDVFKRFKDVADKKKNLADEDILALVTDEVNHLDAVWTLVELQVLSGTTGVPTATVKLRGPDGLPRVASAVGVGPVDAAYKVIDSVVRVPCELADFAMNAVTGGIEALATTRVVVRPSPKLAGFRATYQGEQRVRSFSGMGADEDIVVSAARAYVAALNKMVSYLSAQEEAAEQSAAAEVAAAQTARA